MNDGTIALRARWILTPSERLENGLILVEEGRIAALGEADRVSVPAGVAVKDFGEAILAPGLIDVHTHGCLGHLVGASVDTTLEIARFLARHGTTSFLATTTMAAFEEIQEANRVIRSAMEQPCDGAVILGIHQEGPFISKAGKTQWDRYPPAGFSAGLTARDPSMDDVQVLQEAAGGTLKIMSLAPELDGALEVIRGLVEMGIVPSAAHTVASYEETLKAVAAGLKSATHLYNGMRRQDHREPGIIEAVLTCNDMVAEMIGDGIHVHPPAMDIALRCKGTDGIVLVTDSYTFAGMPNGTYQDPSGREVIKTDVQAQVTGWTLAGSISTLSRNVHNIVSQVGHPLTDALRLATINPARLIGVDDRKGSLAVGKDADLIVIDEQVNVQATMVGGRFVFEA